MNLVIFEDSGHRDLTPLTLTRATFELRCGCDTLREKIESAFGRPPARLLSRGELEAVVADRCATGPAVPQQPTMFINGRLLLRRRLDLACPSACFVGDMLVAACLPPPKATALTNETFLDPERIRTALSGVPTVAFSADSGTLIRYPWDLIAANRAELQRQISAMARSVAQGAVYSGVHLLNEAVMHIGEGSRIKPTAVLDAEDGPIHIGAHVTISPGVVIKGPCSIGDGTLIQPGASIRENTSIGPVCKVGGEIEGTIIQGYSNKQHDGFLGHSVLGEWVNLGADTVTSDLKNTYGIVSVPLHGTPIDTGQWFVGAIIGDHTKTGICTALTTGTVFGLMCNVVTPRPPRYVPSFTWLTESGPQRYDTERAIALARTVMSRRKVSLSPAMESLLRRLATSV